MITTLLLLSIIVILDLVILSVDVLVLSFMLFLIVYKYVRKPKYDYLLYIFALILTVISLLVDIEYVRSGLIAFSMFNIVLFTGVLPDRWQITGKLKAYRVLYSILGFKLILPHVFINLFVDQQINFFGIGAAVIMIPLFITSFNFVKKEMKAEEWIKLQKAAYLVYILLFVHLISIAGWYGKIIYAVMLTLYVNNKLLKEFKK